jgi:hypothetical protein
LGDRRVIAHASFCSAYNINTERLVFIDQLIPGSTTRAKTTAWQPRRRHQGRPRNWCSLTLIYPLSPIGATRTLMHLMRPTTIHFPVLTRLRSLRPIARLLLVPSAQPAL